MKKSRRDLVLYYLGVLIMIGCVATSVFCIRDMKQTVGNQMPPSVGYFILALFGLIVGVILCVKCGQRLDRSYYIPASKEIHRKRLTIVLVLIIVLGAALVVWTRNGTVLAFSVGCAAICACALIRVTREKSFFTVCLGVSIAAVIVVVLLLSTLSVPRFGDTVLIVNGLRFYDVPAFSNFAGIIMLFVAGPILLTFVVLVCSLVLVKITGRTHSK